MAATRVGGPPVVIDIGTRFTMIGFAGEESPRFVFPTVVGYPPMGTSTGNNLEAEYYIGQDLFDAKPLRLVCPLRGGLIEDWVAIETIYAHAFRLLEVNPSRTHVLVTENFFNPRETKERLTQMLFHQFGVGQLYHAQRSVLALIAAQERTGIVIDFEADYLSIVPVYEEYTIPHAMQIHDPPTTTGLEIPFIVKQVGALLDKVDSDIHHILCNSVVLIGSSSTTSNFETTLLEELRKKNPTVKSLRVIAPPERLYLPWRGGSIFGNR